MGLSNTEQKRNSGLISAGLVMLLVLATPLAYAQAPFCGDGNTDPGEQCDDGNDVDDDSCSSICQLPPPPPEEPPPPPEEPPPPPEEPPPPPEEPPPPPEEPPPPPEEPPPPPEEPPPPPEEPPPPVPPPPVPPPPEEPPPPPEEPPPPVPPPPVPPPPVPPPPPPPPPEEPPPPPVPPPPPPSKADLALRLTATPELLTVNGQLTYTITVRNNGPAAATGVHVIDALPPVAVPAGGLADSSQGQCSNTPSSSPQPQALTVDCDLETLAPGAEATVTINVMPTVIGDLINTAGVAAFETDPNLANNSKTETTPVEPEDPAMADLAITAAVGPRASGQGFTYTLTVKNNGPETATGVQLTNDLPRGITLTASPGNCSGTDPMLCDLGELTSSAEAPPVMIDVIRTEVEPDTLPNRAAVNGDQHDPDTTNNFALTSALELPRPQTACNSTRCTLRLTCNRSDLLERRCDNQVITVFVKDTRTRRDTRAGRLSDERAARPPRRVPFAAATIRNFLGDRTENVRLRLTSKGKKLARTLIRQGKKKVKGMMEIRNHVGGMSTDVIRLTVRLK